ncbi:MAG: LLM class flavin-dependent oxidoreductase [Pseudomonadota bacterium]
MPLASRIAVTLPLGPRIEDTIELIKWTEEQGFTDAWFADPGSPDSLTLAAIIAPYAPTLRIGTAIVPVYTRTPPVIAAMADLVGQLLPGRFVLGLGASSHTIVERFNGVPMVKPLTRVRETAALVRAILAGEKTSFTKQQTVFSAGYQQAPSKTQIPIYMAALRPKMIEMAAQHGDGIIFNLWPSSALPKMLDHVKSGAAKSGKTPDDIEIVNRAMVLVTDDKALGRNLFRERFAPYYATPVYNAFLSWAGYGDVAADISAGWQAKDRERTTKALSDELIDEIAVIGSAAEVRERVKAQASAGINTTIIAPLARDKGGIYETLAVFSQQSFKF